MPLVKVLLAVEEVTFSTVALRPLTVVEVPALVLVMDPPLKDRPLDDASPPPATLNPPAENVDVADEEMMKLPEEKMDPPLMVSPFDEDNPADDRAPVRIVEVPALLLINAPPERVSPPDASMPATVRLPVNTVEVPAVVERIFPPVMVSPEEVAMNPEAVNPVYNVEVAAETKLPTPCTDSKLPGVVVPMPKDPDPVTDNRSVPAEF